MSIYRRDDCRLCGSRDLELVLPLTATPLGDSYLGDSDAAKALPSYPIDLFLCRSCGYAGLLDVVDPDEIYPDYIYVTESSLGLQRHFASYAADSLERTGHGAGDLIVDIGSNDGTLLKAYQKHGLCVNGVDPAREIARRATENGLPTIADYFSEKVAIQIESEQGKAALITANNFLANVDDMEGMLRAIEGLLADDGVFIVEFAYVGDLLDGMIFDYIYHEHLSYFGVRPFSKFLNRFGLEPFDLQHSDSKGGSIRLYVKRETDERPVQRIIHETFAREETLGYQDPGRYRRYVEEINQRNSDNQKAIAEMKAKGKRFVGYGASVTSTTLMYHFGFDDILEYIVDDNAAKQNTFSPGRAIPVYPSERLREEGNDICVIVLAWRYAEPILEKWRARVENGTAFLIPLPEIKILA